MDKLSYAWGLAMGKQLQAMGVKEINSVEFKDGSNSTLESPHSGVIPRHPSEYKFMRLYALTALSQ